MATYLVTGGCGFIGSHLADALIAAGHSVRILDDLSTGKLANKPQKADFIRGDVTDERKVAKAMSQIDGCFHLAAIASVERSNLDWIGTHRTNLTGAITVFDTARRAKAAGSVPVVYASSAAVYGDNANIPLAETEAGKPLSAYGADKLGCEQHAFVAGKVHGLPTSENVESFIGHRLLSILAWADSRREPNCASFNRPSTRGTLSPGRKAATPAMPASASMSPSHPALDDAGDRAVALDQEHGGDARDAEGVAGGEVVLFTVEQGRKGDSEFPVELAGVLLVVLRDAVDGEPAGEWMRSRIRERHLADGAGDLEEGEQERTIDDEVVERGLSAVEAGQTEFGRTGAGRKDFSWCRAAMCPVYRGFSVLPFDPEGPGLQGALLCLHSGWSASLSGSLTNVAPRLSPIACLENSGSERGSGTACLSTSEQVFFDSDTNTRNCSDLQQIL